MVVVGCQLSVVVLLVLFRRVMVVVEAVLKLTKMRKRKETEKKENPKAHCCCGCLAACHHSLIRSGSESNIYTYYKDNNTWFEYFEWSYDDKW